MVGVCLGSGWSGGRWDGVSRGDSVLVARLILRSRANSLGAPTDCAAQLRVSRYTEIEEGHTSKSPHN